MQTQSENNLVFTSAPLPPSPSEVSLEVFSKEEMLGTRGPEKKLREGLITFAPDRFHLAFLPPVEERAALLLPDRAQWDLYLLVMPFTVQDLAGEKYYHEVCFHVDISASGASAFDLFPYTTTKDNEVNKSYHFPPDIQVTFPDIRPVIIYGGKSEGHFYWTYRAPDTNTALVPGTKHGLAILQIPRGTTHIEGSIYYSTLIVKRYFRLLQKTEANTETVPFSKLLPLPFAHQEKQQTAPAPPDFFISYTHADQEHALWIDRELRLAGYSTVIQANDFPAGSNFVLEMNKATIRAQRTIMVLSPDYLSALYTQPEWAAAFVQDPTGEKRLLIPVIVRPCKPQGLLASLVHINLVGLSKDEARERLLAGLTPRLSLTHTTIRQGTPSTANAVILTAIPPEYAAVRSHLHELREVAYGGTLYERGLFQTPSRTLSVGLAEIGAGNVSAAVETQRAIDHFQPNVILFVGVAGGLKDVHIGDIVCATKVYGYESGKADTTFKTRPAVHNSSYALVERAKAEARKEDWRQRITALSDRFPSPKVYVGPIAAGEKVLSSTRTSLWKFLRNHFNDALAVEMEGYGILSAVYANRVDALIIRGISDLIENKEESDAQNSQIYAAQYASAFAFELLAKLTLDE